MTCNLCQKLNIYEKSDKLKGISFWQLWEATGRVTTYELVLLSRRVLCSHCIRTDTWPDTGLCVLRCVLLVFWLIHALLQACTGVKKKSHVTGPDTGHIGV